jgi:chemotaxis protein CheX
VGELTNMVSGAARKKLEAEGLSVSAAIPTVVSGGGHSIRHVLGGPSIIIPFDTESGPFFVDVCLIIANGS